MQGLALNTYPNEERIARKNKENSEKKKKKEEKGEK
jgi:hypothetical protein